MSERVLITGGAGFVGSHLADAYLRAGYRVRVLDSLEPQVHGDLKAQGKVPAYLSPDVEFVMGDVRDREAVKRCLAGVDVVSHHAALVGVGQSMYEIARYTDVNSGGAGVVLDVLANERHQVRKMIVASSMSIYGEGAYRRPSSGEVVFPMGRSMEQLEVHRWELQWEDGEILDPIPTPESKPLYPSSIYAINKRDHEEMFLSVGRAYKIPTIALRYFNIYGTRQALSNPYTGVMAIFSSRLLSGSRMVIFEDGEQIRDFVGVRDIADVNVLVTQQSAADYEVLNVGTGRPVSIRQVAVTVAEVMGVATEPDIVGKFRIGDIRHCFPDVSRIKRLLNWEPGSNLSRDMPELVEWVRQQTPEADLSRAQVDLERRNLLR